MVLNPDYSYSVLGVDVDADIYVPCSCERENQWLDEAPYYIDTSLVPRGGARRRKSMEPKALANLNGMLVEAPSKSGSNSGGARDCHTAPSTPANRRDSALWVRTPENNSEERHGSGGDDADGDEDDDDLMLTPVPKTPAPEVIAYFAANVTPASSVGDGDDDQDGVGRPSSAAAAREQLLQRTCPPRPGMDSMSNEAASYAALGEGVLAREKDEGVLQRLMAARRRSLQYAPKVASPLSKAWY